VDPHEHLLGGSGEEGFSTQTPMITLSEIAPHGITTVVGVLGVDTTMKTMAGLLARVKGLKEEGLSAYMWSGGYNVPPTTVTQSIRDDMMFIDEVVGAGEIAIADHRGLCPQAPELAKLVLDTHVGGLLTGKAGVTHFHVGGDDQRLKRLRELLEGDFKCEPEWLYPTHVERNEALMDEAIALAARGAHADMDTVEGSSPGGWGTGSSTAATRAPHRVVRHRDEQPRPARRPVARLRAPPRHPARAHAAARHVEHGHVLKLAHKGRVAAGCDADVLVLRRDSLDVVHVFARGRRLVDDGAMTKREHFLGTSRRRIDLTGEKQ
jgi:beta-aspartyl-dipeptidase (metallo-type)